MPDETNPQLSRSAFLKHGWQSVLGMIADQLPELPVSPKRVRPPGAVTEQQFVGLCEPFCTACQTACPRDAILHDAMGQAYVDAQHAPCVMCTDVPCTRVCPTQALLPVEHPEDICMGTAIIELTVCSAYQGSGCRTCYDVCPLPPGRAIQLIEGLPQIVPEACTGCGVCVHLCPTPGSLSIHVPAG